MYTPEWNAGLNSGKQVGWLSAAWAPGVLAGNAGATAGKWKVAPMPQWDAAKPATGNWGGSSTAVTTQSKNVAAAAKFATWLNTDPAKPSTALVEVAGIYPADTEGAKTALTAAPEFFSNQPDFYDVIGEAAQSVGSFNYGPNVNVAFNAYNDQFAKAAQAKTRSAFLDAVDSDAAGHRRGPEEDRLHGQVAPPAGRTQQRSSRRHWLPINRKEVHHGGNCDQARPCGENRGRPGGPGRRRTSDRGS